MKTATRERPAATPSRSLPKVVGIETPDYGCGSELGAIAQGLAEALALAGASVGVLGNPNCRGFGLPAPAPEGCDSVISLAEPWAWRPQLGQRFVGIVRTPIDAVPGAWVTPMRVASSVFAPSKWLAGKLGAPARALRFGVRQEFRVDPDREPGSDGFRALFIAEDAADPRAGMDIAVSAFQKAFPDEENVELVVRSIQRQGVEKNDRRVRFAFGAMTPAEAAKLYRSADVVLYTSRCEAYPMAAIEALACGTPVIHSGKCGASEIVDLGILSISRPISASGATWHEMYPEELAVTLRELARRPDAARELALRDATTVDKAFRWNLEPLLRSL